MIDPMWENPERFDNVRAQMLHPVTFEFLDELPVTGGSQTEDWWLDTRTSAQLTTIDFDKYIDLAAIRIWHDWSFPSGKHGSECIGTYYVSDTPQTWGAGAESVTLELKSTLWAMNVDLLPAPFAVAKGAKGQDVVKRACEACNRKYSLVSGYVGWSYPEAVVYDVGMSYLYVLYWVTTTQNDLNHIDVDVNGTVTYSKLVWPKDRNPDFELEFDGPLVMSQGVRRESNELSIPGRSVVTWNYRPEGSDAEEQIISAYADVAQGLRSHISRRGFRVTEVHNMSSMESNSQAEAQRMASEFLPDDSSPTVEWEVPCRWFPVHEGDVCKWKRPDGKWVKTLVWTVERNLKEFTMTLTLREV